MKNRLLRVLTLSFAILVFWPGSGLQAVRAGESVSVPKPIIGINTDVDGEKPEVSSVESTYIEAIARSGGIPVLLPPMSAEDLARVMPHLDGILMTGGADYPPALYHQETHPSVSLMKNRRSDFDLTLVKAVLADKSMPFLGICAGCQALNIGCGGTLTQDIPSMKPESKIKHSSPSGWKQGFNKHQVVITRESRLAHALGQTELNVVTSHHQCVDAPGQGLTVTARSADGVTEAIEKNGECFVLGVQFHPERDIESNHKLFEELVRQAAQRQQARSAQKTSAPGASKIPG